MDFDSVIKKRRSVHSFKNKEVSWRDICKAIESARNIPLAGNHNTINYTIVRERKAINDIAECAEQDWINDVNILVVVSSDEKILEKLYDERGRIYSRQQAGAAIHSFLLKLVDLGLSACWVGSFNDNRMRRILEIPPHIQVEAIIPIGYEKLKTPVKKKKDLEIVTSWEKWNQKRIH
ncbi:hypothetical protein COU54_05250 [Candidatus Pacearchaeota archaeon CG10_big_fil_rev_8_21_14_0_10_31_24]|nr:MAG: hypothetical protein COU54_05250 [Candidatus Pacearchaeota archaeon CG10_big_fil_rev_8_21_14_0_10_31_24]